MHWTKSRLAGKIISKFQRNMMTMNQTSALSVIFYFNNISIYVLSSLEDSVPGKYLFLFDICRIIVVENILLKFLLPVVLIARSRTNLPSLWLKTTREEKEFYFWMGSIKPRKDLSMSLLNEAGGVKFIYLTNRIKKLRTNREEIRNDIIFVKEQPKNGKFSRFLYV